MPGGALRDKLLRLGFKSAVAGARVTEKNGRSGGVAIAWRSHLNVTGPQVVHPHRAVSVELHTHGAGDIHLVCVYGDVLGTWQRQALHLGGGTGTRRSPRSKRSLGV